MENLLFYLAFATLMAHELDAMTQAEWRLLLGLSRLPDAIAEMIFVLAHIPLVAVLLWITNSENPALRRWSRIAVAIFLVIHAGLHKRLDHSALYTFDSDLSLGLIYGGGALGLLYVLAVLIIARRPLPVDSQTTN